MSFVWAIVTFEQKTWLKGPKGASQAFTGVFVVDNQIFFG